MTPTYTDGKLTIDGIPVLTSDGKYITDSNFKLPNELPEAVWQWQNNYNSDWNFLTVEPSDFHKAHFKLRKVYRIPAPSPEAKEEINEAAILHDALWDIIGNNVSMDKARDIVDYLHSNGHKIV